MTAILAIDQGTSATKAIVVDDSGAVIADVEQPVAPNYIQGGGVEQDPQELLNSVLESGRRAVAQANVPVAHIALANQGETVLAWDPESGRPLSKAIVWQDRRAESICRCLSEHADLFAQKTGLVLDQYFSAPKMKWLRDNVTRRGVVTTTDTWLVHAFCGEFVTDASTASRSLLFGIDELVWDQDLLRIFGLAGERLPRVVRCDEPIGTTTSFGTTMTVGGLIVDQAAALLAQRCLLAGQAKCTFGTGAFLLANTGDTAARPRSALTASVAWKTASETAYYLDGQVYTAGSAVRWLIDLGVISGADELDRVAAPNADGVLCVPALAGLAAPWWQPRAAASLTGMNLASGRGQIVMALLQGIAAQVAEVLDALSGEAEQQLTILRVDGGLTRSRVLMQAVADVSQIPVELYPSPHATALGAAALARMSRQPGIAPSDAIDDWQSTLIYEPRWSLDQAQEFRSRWLSVAEANLPSREDS